MVTRTVQECTFTQWRIHCFGNLVKYASNSLNQIAWNDTKSEEKTDYETKKAGKKRTNEKIFFRKISDTKIMYSNEHAIWCAQPRKLETKVFQMKTFSTLTFLHIYSYLKIYGVINVDFCVNCKQFSFFGGCIVLSCPLQWRKTIKSVSISHPSKIPHSFALRVSLSLSLSLDSREKRRNEQTERAERTNRREKDRICCLQQCYSVCTTHEHSTEHLSKHVLM